MTSNYANSAPGAQAKAIVQRGAAVACQATGAEWASACYVASKAAEEALSCLIEDAEAASEQTVSVGRIKRLREFVLMSAAVPRG